MNGCTISRSIHKNEKNKPNKFKSIFFAARHTALLQNLARELKSLATPGLEHQLGLFPPFSLSYRGNSIFVHQALANTHRLLLFFFLRIYFHFILNLFFPSAKVIYASEKLNCTAKNCVSGMFENVEIKKCSI